MYRRIEDFVHDWTNERNSTLKLFRNITDASLKQRIDEPGRELGRLANHITESIGEMLHRAGLEINGAPKELHNPLSAAEIVSRYDVASQAALEAVQTQWTNAALTEEVDMYGRTWTKGTVLSVVIGHQTHHRGQLTVLMRQAGLVVPGMYGPAREEWVAYGMPVLT